MKYNKLVRDKIPEYIKSKGGVPITHVAIMKKSWGLTEKILSGRKKIESRWYSIKHKPWDRVKKGDIVYFKDSGESVKIKARVNKVVQSGVFKKSAGN